MHAPPCQRGFTLVELIMTLIVVGVISAVAIPRFFDTNIFQSRGAADQVKAALRYAQKVAIAQHRPVHAAISQGSSGCAAALAGGHVDCAIPVAVVSQTFWFNALGQLSDSAGTVTVNGSVTVGAAPNATLISIDAETGYVH